MQWRSISMITSPPSLYLSHGSALVWDQASLHGIVTGADAAGRPPRDHHLHHGRAGGLRCPARSPLARVSSDSRCWGGFLRPSTHLFPGRELLGFRAQQPPPPRPQQSPHLHRRAGPFSQPCQHVPPTPSSRTQHLRRARLSCPERGGGPHGGQPTSGVCRTGADADAPTASKGPSKPLRPR